VSGAARDGAPTGGAPTDGAPPDVAAVDVAAADSAAGEGAAREGAAPTASSLRRPLDAELEHALTFRWSDLPTVTPDLPGCGGRLRADPDEFLVRELPLYLPSGQGSHAYARVEKVGWTTRDLQRALVDAGVPIAQIGVAGLKDKVARTEQWLSVPRRHESGAWAALEALDGVRVLETSRHVNKLAIGHLRGNAFRIRVRGAAPDAAARVGAVAASLAVIGVPNYFGPQRFGRHGHNAIDGWRLVRGERVPGDQRLKRFFMSALQSQLFNLFLAERIRDGLYRGVVEGDWARKHDTGGTFAVVDAGAEAPRAAALEISATLPLYGKKVRPSAAVAGSREARVLEGLGLRWTDLVRRHGDRRITRIAGVAVEVEDGGPGPDGEGASLWLAFELPKGSYATTLLREVMKVDVDAPLDDPSSSGP
jgi:tRNA pseudouridine13 synthase